MDMKKHKKARRKLPLLKFCTCMAVDQDEYPDAARPYAKTDATQTSPPPDTSLDNPESPLHNDGVITKQDVANFTHKHSIENEELPCEAPDIEIPPPMAVQQASILAFQQQGGNPGDIAEKFASTLSLKKQPDVSLGLANEIENLVFQRMESQPDTGQGSDSGGEDDKEAEQEKCLQKRQYVIQELLETEQDYVKDLGGVVEGYMNFISETGDCEEELKAKQKFVFGNIHQIYDWHRETFSEELQKCCEDPEKLVQLFITYKRRWRMYETYCKNKPKSECIVQEYVDTAFEEIRQKLGHKLNLADLLIKPVQRIMKYQLILKDILKYSERAGLNVTGYRAAYNVMCVVPKEVNDMMQFGRLEGYEGNIMAVGKLLLQDTLLVAEVTSQMNTGSKGNQLKFKGRRVFLFEQIILLSEMTERRRGNIVTAHYMYKNCLKVNKMSMIENVDNDPIKFMLKDQTPGADMRFVVQAPSEDVKQTWVTSIQKILEMQGDFLRALQSPIAYNKEKELTKELSAPELGNSTKDGQLRKTQSQPQTGRGGNPASNLLKGHIPTDQHKHLRCKSVPAPSLEAANQTTGQEVKEFPCPSSPSECSKDFNQEKDRCTTAESELANPSAACSALSSDSVRPKKKPEGLRNALKKSKNESGIKGDCSYANSLDGVSGEAELRTSSHGNETPPTKPDSRLESLENEQNAVSQQNSLS